MVNVVLATLGRAGLARLGADSADIVNELGVAAHELGRRPTQGGAIFVESNARGHLADVLLSEARVGAVLALLGTVDTGGDA